MLAFPFLQLVGYLPSNPAWCRLVPSSTPGFWEEQPGFMALVLPHRNWLTRAGGTCRAGPNPTETSGQLGRGKMVASKEGAGQHGPLPIVPGFTILTPRATSPKEGGLQDAGRRGGEGRGCRAGAPRALEPPVLPSSRGLSALGGSVGTRSSRCFVLVHLGAEPLMHS